jgi:uncharacterized protein (DUF2252 family)
VSRQVVERIRAFNARGQPDMVKLKLAKLRTSPFVFLRGTCHLFYEDWPAQSALNAAPLAWVCGDLHLENFGTYKGDNRLAYFDVNDFDESVLAPVTWEVTRFVTSLLVAARDLRLAAADANALARQFLCTYAETLSLGHARSVERPTAVGQVHALLRALKRRRRAAFLDGRTKPTAVGLRLKLDQERQLPASARERAQVGRCLERLGRRRGDAEFFKVLDVARRVAGTGSLGWARYIILVEGRGSPDRNFLVDLKEARPSALAPYVTAPQPAWATEAERVVVNQARFQSMPPALLAAVALGRQYFIARELQPLQDRVSLVDWSRQVAQARRVIETMAQVTAWGHLRCSGRQGAAVADELMQFGRTPGWPAVVLQYAHRYAAQVLADYRDYVAAVAAETR